MEAATTPTAGTTANGNGHATADDQQGLFDRVIENGDLLKALEDREKVNASRKALNAKFKEAHEVAKGIIATLALDDGTVVRCGRFRIEKSGVSARSVAFETDPTSKLTISLLDD